MKLVDPDAVLAELARHQDRGFHVDSRLLAEVPKPGNLFRFRLGQEEDFFRLVWQSTSKTRPLTPEGWPRTLRDCVLRLRTYSWSFRQLVTGHYEWFQECVAIDENFTYDNFGLVALTPLNSHERHETPQGTYYLFDGVHKGIVLAKKVFRGEVDYQPVEALLLTPRRD